MRDASICGLGQAASNPLTCVMRYFPGSVCAQGGVGMSGTIPFELDGEQVEAQPDETLGRSLGVSARRFLISAIGRSPATGRTEIAAPAW